MYQTDSKNYETCAIVIEIIFPIKTGINTHNFFEVNLFGKFDRFVFFWLCQLDNRLTLTFIKIFSGF